MKQTEISASIVELLISNEQLQPRSAGVHVSTVIKHMRTIMGKQAGWPDEELNNAGQIGRIWEHVLARELANAGLGGQHIVRPGEITCEGIIGSPDGVDCEDPAIVEFKATWKSSKRPVFEIAPWYKWQVLAYCYMVELATARLYVLYVNGDYKPPMPQVRGWRYEFSPGEIKSNWQMILRNAKDLARAQQ